MIRKGEFCALKRKHITRAKGECCDTSGGSSGVFRAGLIPQSWVSAQPITSINAQAERDEEACSNFSAWRLYLQQRWKQDPTAWLLNFLLIAAPEVNEAFPQPSGDGAQGWEAQLGAEMGKESRQCCLGNLPELPHWDAPGCRRDRSYPPCH